MVCKKGIKVLLVYVNSAMDNLIPVGPSILSACLKQAGHDVKLFDTTFYQLLEKTGDDMRTKTLQVKKTNLADFGITKKTTDIFEDFKNRIKQYKPDLICMSCVDPTYWIAELLLKSIQDIKILKIAGGMGVTFSTHILEEPFIDGICRGEGEDAIVELADRIRDGKDYTDVRNLWIKKDGKVYKNELRPLIDLNKLPHQDWSIYEEKRFFKPMSGKVSITGNFEVMRGCMNACAYCCAPALQRLYKNKGSYLRWKNIDKLIDEVKALNKKYNLQYIYFTAENFLGMADDNFAKFIKGYKDIKLPFWVEGRPELVVKERLEQLKEVGCSGLNIGIEHGNPEFRIKMLNRYSDNKVIIKAFKTVKKVEGLRSCADNIIGFPDETREFIFDTIKLNRKANADGVVVNLFNPYSGTKLREVAIKKGYLSPKDFGRDNRIDAILNMPQLSKEQLLGLHRTFVLYVKLPLEKWPLIERAEKFDKEGNKIFEELSELYFEKYCK